MNGKSGFTMVEMLVVIGIIAILSGALLAGFGSVSKSAQRAKAQEAVSNAATALTLYYQEKQEWPQVILDAANGDRKMGVNVAKVLADKGLMGINCKKDSQDPHNLQKMTLLGTDRFGIADPWAIAVMKRNKDAALGTAVPSGGTIEDHLLYFAVDTDDDGIVEAQLEGGMRKIRAVAVVWCAGRDGKLASYSLVGRSDDVYSWQRAQEAK